MPKKLCSLLPKQQNWATHNTHIVNWTWLQESSNATPYILSNDNATVQTNSCRWKYRIGVTRTRQRWPMRTNSHVSSGRSQGVTTTRAHHTCLLVDSWTGLVQSRWESFRGRRQPSSSPMFIYLVVLSCTENGGFQKEDWTTTKKESSR